MCGIGGVVDLEKRAVEPETLLLMSKAISHRGTDDEGYILISTLTSGYRTYAGEDSVLEIKGEMPVLNKGANTGGMDVGLCHRRFSIIDLSFRGHQPFMDWEKRCSIVFNGEIFNYLELREELERRGHKFFSSSDTEVIAEAYKEWGPDSFGLLNGFWAIALFDFKNSSLILSRDRLGKKPLYWTKKGGRIYFASEIKAILQVPELKRGTVKVNEEVAYYWLEYGFRDFIDATFFDDIYSLPPASWTYVDNDFPNNMRFYWGIPERRMKEREIPVDEASSRLKEIIKDAVKIRLRADVPWSIELSGGLDSSSIVAIASQIAQNRPHVITVRFPEEEWNEEPYARSIAQNLNVDYHVIDPPIANAWQQLMAFTYLHEEPYHSPNLRVFQLYWSIMRSQGTKISLQGTGGDELFAGYNYYFPLALIDGVKGFDITGVIKNLLKWTEYRQGVHANMRLIFYFLRTLLPWVRVKHRFKNFIRIKPPEGKGIPFKSFQDALLSDMTRTKMRYWLLSFDKNSMGIPIEVRSPLLDYRVVDFAMSLPLSYLIKDGWHKWILRKTMEDVLPKDVVWREKKMGFPFPYERFISESNEIINLIMKEAHNPYLDFSRQELFRDNWYVISFILWYELFINRNQNLFTKIELLANNRNPSPSLPYTPQYLREFSFS
ncbi:MAG: asparagine synthase (glutamine-hydrolyzing) [Syntrophorhabdaceae bacterium]|nr:asparagine synthase (glutamine-hydrolyzing) [Syntrophorhabdaceae bacterium]